MAGFPSDEEAPLPLETFHALISGRVQGVGFRFFVLEQARRLNVTGNVRNLPDGRVEVHARGRRDQLEALDQALRKGPWMARVDDVTIHWGADVRSRPEFIIGS